MSLSSSRLEYKSKLPQSFVAGVASRGDSTAARSAADAETLRSWFPHTLGQPLVNIRSLPASSSSSASSASPSSSSVAATVVASSSASGPVKVGILFCGRQSPGGHNVICGLYDNLVAANPLNELYGIVGGTMGLFERKTLRITAEVLAPVRNQGGFHLLGRSVDKIRSPAEQKAALESVQALGLHGLVLLGGTFTNTDAAHLAEYFAARQVGTPLKTCVVGVPITIDGDIQNPFVEATLGHDTATKVFSQVRFV